MSDEASIVIAVVVLCVGVMGIVLAALLATNHEDRPDFAAYFVPRDRRSMRQFAHFRGALSGQAKDGDE